MKKGLLILLGCIHFTYSQSTIKTMFYNVLNYPVAPPSDREVILESIIDTYEPDIFMICELETETGGQEILNSSLNDDNTNYSSAPFLTNLSSSGSLHQLLYYNNQKFNLIQSQRLLTTIRDINWYTLELIAANPIRIEVFVAHLKASQGESNENKRLEMVNTFVENLENLNDDDYVIFAGDFNVYTANEPAYRKLLDLENKIVMVDPIFSPGNWHTNSSFSNIHTQSTRISNTEFDDYGSGGGLDDRFDFILVSENMTTNSALSYIDNSYHAYGNNGNCYNNRIDSNNCTGTYDSTLRENLYMMSDHLPVVLELAFNENILNTSEFSENTPILQLPKGNIVQNELYLQFLETPIPIDFKIYNTLGQEMKSFSSENNTIMKISISELSDGMYYLTPINFQNRTKTIKFIKRN